MPTGAKNGKSHLVAVRLPLDLEELLMQEARARDLPYSQIIIAAIRDYLQKEDAKG